MTTIKEELQNIVDGDKFDITIDAIHGDNKLGKFVKAFGVFEQGKQLAIHDRFIVIGNPNLDNLCQTIKDALEKSGRNVVFVGIRDVNGIRVETRPWILEGVQSISNGEKWGLLKSVLNQMDYYVETNEHMMVTKVEKLKG